MAKGILDLFGGNTDSEDRQVKRKLDEMGNLVNDLDTPVFEDIVPNLYQYQGDLNPASTVTAQTVAAPDSLDYEKINPYLADTFLAGDSRMSDISTDPRLKDNQMAALASLQGIVDSGGMTAQETANLARIQGDVASADKGRRDAILQGMQQRGQSGGGLELLAQLQSSQAATDQASQAGLDINAQAQQRALDAIMNQGNLSGQMRGQDFGEQSQIASAQDAINRFNTQNQNTGSQFNAGVSNSANQFNAGNMLDAGKFNIQGTQQNRQFNAGQEQGAQQFNANTANDFAKANWGAKQDTANMNTGASNQAMMQNKINTPQTMFDNQTKKTGMQQGALGSQADYYTTMGDRKKKEAAETMGAVVKGGTALGGAALSAGALASDERVKEDIAEVSNADVEEFFNAVNPKSFQYKLNEYGEGEKVGFMIQDIENTKLGKKIVREIDGVKYYDKQGLDGILLSAVSLLMSERNK
jgi:hypothetical protein